MLDFKKIIQLGLGIAIGMVAYHFIQKAIDSRTSDSSNGDVAGAFGRRRRTRALTTVHHCNNYNLAPGTTCESQCDNANGVYSGGSDPTCTTSGMSTFPGIGSTVLARRRR